MRNSHGTAANPSFAPNMGYLWWYSAMQCIITNSHGIAANPSYAPDHGYLSWCSARSPLAASHSPVVLVGSLHLPTVARVERMSVFFYFDLVDDTDSNYSSKKREDKLRALILTPTRELGSYPGPRPPGGCR